MVTKKESEVISLFSDVTERQAIESDHDRYQDPDVKNKSETNILREHDHDRNKRKKLPTSIELVEPKEDRCDGRRRCQRSSTAPNGIKSFWCRF